MREQIVSTWEQIDQNTWRMRVTGGWIVKSVYHYVYQSVSIHQVYVPDGGHLWTVEPMIEEAGKK